jgi:hypothetical protein
MAAWFASSGLEVDQVRHLKGGELTVTLWRGSKPVLSDAGGGVEGAAVPQRRAA